MMKMDKYMSCVDFLLYSTFRISIREGAMSEDEIIDKLIESAYQDATTFIVNQQGLINVTSLLNLPLP